MESMGGISAYARTESGFTFCRCSVNRYYCDRTHAQYKLTTAWEFKHYLPVVLANFATGNNSWNEKSRTENRGTGTAFMLRAAEAYGLEFTVSKSSEEAKIGGITPEVLSFSGRCDVSPWNMRLPT